MLSSHSQRIKIFYEISYFSIVSNFLSVKLNFATDVVDETNWRLGSMKLQLRPDGRR